jgi:hypothetical protein
MIEQIKARVAEVEKAIQDVIAQHAKLMGHLNEAKHFLSMAEKAAEVVAPESPVTKALETMEEVVEKVS